MRGKYLPRLAKGANVVVLDRDMAKVFPERETRVREFEQLAHHRAAGDRAYLDAGDEWKATPAVLRSMVDCFNQ